MKRQFFTALLTLVIVSTAFSQEKYTIEGKLTGVDKASKIYLSFVVNGAYKSDSATLSNGEFTFSGIVASPVKATLEFRTSAPSTTNQMLDARSRDMQDFYLDKGLITVAGNKLNTAVIQGGKTQSEYRMLKDKRQPMEDEIASLTKPMAALFEKRDMKGMEEVRGKLQPLRQQIATMEDNFVKEFPASYISLNIVESRISDPSSLQLLYPLLSASLRSTPSGKNMGERIISAKRTDVGQPAIDFTRTTLDGKNLSLALFKGKYILLDFWGSWCGPCRASFPHLKELYSKYKDEGLVVVGIAQERTNVEDGKKRWKNAVEADGLPWPQVMNDDESLAKFDIVKAYGLSGFPTQVLIDKEGTIIARYLGASKNLDDKLKEIYGK
jgi:thiol-disulfide isomerase/thioredoxin